MTDLSLDHARPDPRVRELVSLSKETTTTPQFAASPLEGRVLDVVADVGPHVPGTVASRMSVILVPTAVSGLSAWWETELHSEAEQAALRYTEALTRVADTDRDAAFQRFHDALVEHFGPQEMLEIVAVVVNMNAWTRINLAEGAMPGPTR